MKAISILLLGAATFLASSQGATLSAQSRQPVAKWPFDETDGAATRNSVTGTEDKISGFFLRVPGVSGQALQFDGDTTSVVEAATTLPPMSNAFTVDAWIAINTYPWNWVPIVDRRNAQSAGYLFGIDSFGHLGLQVAVDGQWRVLTSAVQLPLKKWARCCRNLRQSCRTGHLR